MPNHSLRRIPTRFLRRASSLATFAILVASLITADRARAAIVFFPVNSGGAISQPGTGQQPVTVAFGDIDLGAGTFAIATDFNSGTSFGVGLNAPDTSAASQFFSQSNNSIAWLVSSGTISLLSAGASVGSGTYSSSDPNFGGDWKSGISPGYAGLQMTSGSDVYYGWTSINYVVGSPNQVTVTAFAFENQPNTPITVAAVPEPTTSALALGCGIAAASMLAFGRWRRQNS